MKQTPLPVAVLAFSLAVTTALGGCVPLVVGGAAVGTALVATDRRSVGAQADDEAIELKIANLISTRYGDSVHVSTTSYNGQVLLSGEANDPATVAAIGDLARTTDRVRSVANELAPQPPAALSSRTNDTYITSKVKARFVEANKFAATHVKVVTDRGIVYLMGLVNRDEGNAAAQIASTTTGVVRVVKLFEYI
ncbi:MAG TPA: BON domain-containing protein [Casimicrobiaceae bacterium]|nr:BON domain-containing protein [Casimicrobiaceae bacterium]